MMLLAAATGGMHDSVMADEASRQGRAVATSTVARLVAGLALLAIVAFASTARLSSRETFAPTTVGGVALASVTVLLGLLVLFALVIAGSTGRDRRTRHKFLATLVASLLLAGLVASLLSVNPRAPGKRVTPTLPRRPNAERAKRAAKNEKPKHVSSLPSIVAGASLVGLLLIAGVAVAIAGRRRRPLAGEGPAEHPMLQAFDESLDDLRAERDVRRAIIACYARMERALARTGAARRPSETPFEFLARVLEHIARAPGRVLTDLFERAKFSTEPLGDADKQQALAALEALRAAAAEEHA